MQGVSKREKKCSIKHFIYVKYKQFMEITFNWLFNVQLFTSKITPEVGEIKHLNDSI